MVRGKVNYGQGNIESAIDSFLDGLRQQECPGGLFVNTSCLTGCLHAQLAMVLACEAGPSREAMAREHAEQALAAFKGISITAQRRRRSIRIAIAARELCLHDPESALKHFISPGEEEDKYHTTWQELYFSGKLRLLTGDDTGARRDLCECLATCPAFSPARQAIQKHWPGLPIPEMPPQPEPKQQPRSIDDEKVIMPLTASLLAALQPDIEMKAVSVPPASQHGKSWSCLVQ